MLCKINGNVIEGNVYEIKHTLKNLGCVWNSEAKRWETSKFTKLDEVKKALDHLNKEQQEKMSSIWNEACAVNRVKFCRRNDDVYDKVKETFKELLEIDRDMKALKRK